MDHSYARSSSVQRTIARAKSSPSGLADMWSNGLRTQSGQPSSFAWASIESVLEWVVGRSRVADMPCENGPMSVVGAEGRAGEESDDTRGDVEADEVRAAADRKSTRLNSSHSGESRMPSSA